MKLKKSIVVLFLLLLVCVLIVLVCKTNINRFTNIFSNNDYRNLSYTGNTLEVELKNFNNEWKYNIIEIHPLLADKLLINKNGRLKYQLTPKESEELMDQLFPLYTGPTIPSTNIDQSVMLSVDIPKYNKIRSETIKLLEDYKIPPLEVFYGYTPETVKESRFYELMKNPDNRNELTVGMLEIFDNFVNKYPNKNAWMLYLEDDVRIINLKPGSDVSILYNIPPDAELIRVHYGANEMTSMELIKYKKSYNGGLNHALYISVSACKKVLKYAKKHKWKYPADIDLYKLAVGAGGFPTGYSGWSFVTVYDSDNIGKLIPEEDKIHMYSMDHIIFNQTSVPVVPLN